MAQFRKRRISHTIESLEPRFVLDSTMVFNEIMYNPIGNNENLEWIELHNQMAIDMDLSLWRLDDAVNYTIPAGTIVPGGGYLVIAADPIALEAATGVTAALGPWTGRLSNAGENLELINNSDRVMNAIDFRDAGSWPVGPDGSGSTLAKIDPLSASEPAANWRTSQFIGGTPGFENFPPPGKVSLPQGIISYWNLDEPFGPANDQADGNNGTLGPDVTRTGGIIGAGALEFDGSTGAFLNVGAGTNDNFSLTSGVTIEAIVESNWDGAGKETLFQKNSDPGSPLVSYWSFDESDGSVANSDVQDFVGGNHGTLVGSATHTPGIFGQGAGRFNNINSDAVVVGPGVGENFDLSDGIAISAWITPEWLGNVFTFDSIFYKNDGANRISLEFQRDISNSQADPPVAGSLVQVLSFGLNVGGAIRELDMPLGANLAAIANGPSDAGTIYLNPPGVALGPNDVVLKDGNSHHVAATYDVETGEKAIWIDGVKRWFRQYAAGSVISTGGLTPAVLGNRTAGSNHAFRGVIDEVAIWGDAISSTQIEALAAGTTPLNLPSASETNTTLHLSLQNDGNGGSANPPVAPGPVLSFGMNTGGSFQELDMPLDGVDGRPTLAEFTDGSARHVAATYDSLTGEKAIWIDGVNVWSVVTTPGDLIDSSGGGLAIIGNSEVSGTTGFSGKIDEVAFWNVALSSEDLQDHAQSVDEGVDYFSEGNTLPATLAFSEAAAEGESFWLEIANYGDEPVDLGGHVLAGSEDSSHRFVLPEQVLLPGGLLVVSAAELGFTSADGDRIFLMNPVETIVLDAMAVDNELRGRAELPSGRWLFPAESTPGVANSFAFQDDIIINEIFYHGQPQFANSAQNAQTKPVSLGGIWDFDQSNTDLAGTGWQDVDFVPAGWSSGPGTFGVSGVATDYSSVVLADDPLSYWRLADGGPLVSDASGNGHTGSANAGVKFGQSSLLGNQPGDSSINTIGTSRVTVPGFEKFPAGSTGYSVEYWIQLQSAPTGFHNIVGDGEAGGDFFLMNYLTGSGQIRPHFNGAGAVSTDSIQTLAVGQTYHVVTTWDQASGLGAIYINGALDKEVPIGSGNPANSSNSIFLGRDDRESGGNFLLDEVAIYNRALSGGEIAEHFDAGGGIAFDTPLDADPSTYYFRKEFTFDGDPNAATIELRTLVDDGAVFYLNGQEIHRQNLPVGPIEHVTFATADIGTPVLSSAIPIAAQLVQGKNVLAVELHSSSVLDDDALFAAELTVTEAQDIEQPFLESDEEWIELYNRGTTTVDLSGWSFDDAIKYTFPEGTTIEPDGYLVVAKDAEALAAKHPGIEIVGNFNRKLSNSSDHILLKDATKNPADEVTYYDGGRWADFADGGGSSLELRDPQADNSIAEAWAASDETDRSEWRTYTYRGIAANPPGSNNPATYNEFSFGLLDAGEFLIDEISVIENPGTPGEVQFIQNSTFETEIIGSSPSTWRVVGNHHGNVVADPDDPDNKVLRVFATGAEEHMANHAETTLKNGGIVETIQLGTEYEISFRAKWLGGSPQLNTRMFFKLPRTTILDTPSVGGTPGMKNSVVVAQGDEVNIGPTFSDFGHFPITPSPGENITVFATPADDDGVDAMTLMYSTGGGFVTVEMMPTDDGQYSGTIPGQNANSVVQFYVEGTDTLGATSTFPAAGPDSRALLKVGADSSTTGLQNIQIIMTSSDASLIARPTNLMSNDRLGATVVYEGKVYYDAGVRLKGSEHGRPDPNRRGYSIEFPPDDLFRGVQKTIGIDRSGGWRFGRQFGQDEILIYQFFNRAGGFPSMVNDLIFVDAPAVANGTAILQLSRYTDTFLDSQFENGSDGTRFEYELIYTLVPSGGVEGLKAAQEGPSVFGIPVGRDLGDDKEAYRHNFLIKNNNAADDFSGMIELAKAFTLSGDAFHARTQELLDVDEWLRTFAALSLSGSNDNYNAGSQHNAQFYQRPSDGKILLFPFDMDFSFILSPTAPLSSNGDLNKLRTLPDNEHAFLGHLQDIVTTSFNTQYMSDWVSNFDDLLPGQNLSSILTWIGQRSNFVLNQMPPQVPFELLGDPPTVMTTTLLAENSSASVLVPSVVNGGDQLDNTWTTVDFTESADWTTGVAGVGYERDPADYADLINLDVSEMIDTNESAFVRMPFEFTGDASAFDSLKLRMKYDDGFVAYLNGVKIAEANAPANPTWNSGANAPHVDAAAVIFQDFDITDHISDLIVGENILAIHGLNRLLSSSDFLISPEIVGEVIEAGDGGADAIVVDTPSVDLGGTGWVNVREIRIAGQSEPVSVTWNTTTSWEANIPLQPGTHQLTFEAYDFQDELIGTDTITVTSNVPRPVIDNLRISELMYHPSNPTQQEIAAGFTDSDSFEFVELVNLSDTTTLDLGGVTFSDGVSFTFPEIPLAPGGRVIVVSNQGAFAERYGSDPIVIGQYTGQFRNSGEHVRLVDAANSEVLDFTYDDNGPLWHPSTDGDGPSLVIIDEMGDRASWNDPTGWRPSFENGGSPGETDQLLGDLDGDHRVGMIDLNIIQANIGTPNGAAQSDGDLNGDGAVTVADFRLLAGNFGQQFIPPVAPAMAPSAAPATAEIVSTINTETMVVAVPILERDVSSAVRLDKSEHVTAADRVLEGSLQNEIEDTNETTAVRRRARRLYATRAARRFSEIETDRF